MFVPLITNTMSEVASWKAVAFVLLTLYRHALPAGACRRHLQAPRVWTRGTHSRLLILVLVITFGSAETTCDVTGSTDWDKCNECNTLAGCEWCDNGSWLDPDVCIPVGDEECDGAWDERVSEWECSRYEEDHWKDECGKHDGWPGRNNLVCELAC